VGAELERAIDRLYSVPPAEFVAERQALVRALRSEGRKDDAAAVGALRKPTRVAWAINQLAHDDRRDVDLLLDAGHRLRSAYASGRPDEALRAAIEGERALVKKLTGRAEKRLEEDGTTVSASTLAEISASLHAGAILDEGRELLARGRLTTTLAAPSLEDLPAGPGGPPESRPRGKRKPAAGAPDEERQRRQELAQAREKAKRARTRHAEALKAAREAERNLDRAAREHAAAESLAAEARAVAADAERALADAETELERLVARSARRGKTPD
jgi:hypothetical protein